MMFSWNSLGIKLDTFSFGIWYDSERKKTVSDLLTINGEGRLWIRPLMRESGLTKAIVLGEKLDTIHWVLVLHCIVVFQKLDNDIVRLEMVVRSLTRHDFHRIDIVLCQSTNLLQRNQQLINKLVKVSTTDPLDNRL